MNVVEEAVGKWHGILPRFGVDARYLTGRHGPCPMCGGRDRWRFDNKEGRGTWFCNRCGAGDGFRLIELLKGKRFVEVMDEVRTMVGGVEKHKVLDKPDEAGQMAYLAMLWKAAKPLAIGDPVIAYLASRGLAADSVVGTRDIRWLHDIRHLGGEMIALYRDKYGKPAQMQRTNLETKERKFIYGLNMPEGGAIRLGAGQEAMGIAEGIETALSAATIFDIPVWAALNAGQIEKWCPPAEAKQIYIFGDNDSSYVGQAASYNLAKRLVAAGQFKVTIQIPEKPDTDWNDVLRSRA